MSATPLASPDRSGVDAPIRALYRQLLASWNRRDAGAFAAAFVEDGTVIGFDGSPVGGRDAIRESNQRIFDHHATGRYVGKVRDVRRLGDGVALLSAVSGVVPAGAADLNPALNALQTLVAVYQDGAWRIAHYQNTPAQFHGRPELVEALTAELREIRSMLPEQDDTHRA